MKFYLRSVAAVLVIFAIYGIGYGQGIKDTVTVQYVKKICKTESFCGDDLFCPTKVKGRYWIAQR